MAISIFYVYRNKKKSGSLGKNIFFLICYLFLQTTLVLEVHIKICRSLGILKHQTDL